MVNLKSYMHMTEVQGCLVIMQQGRTGSCLYSQLQKAEICNDV